MNDEAMFEDIDGAPIRQAYIRVVHKSDVENAPDDAPDMLYALHDEDGRPLALFSSHDNAVVTAINHNFEPVTLH